MGYTILSQSYRISTKTKNSLFGEFLNIINEMISLKDYSTYGRILSGLYGNVGFWERSGRQYRSNG